MIPAELVLEIERLWLAGQLSQRQIAKTVGVARATVASVIAGRRTSPRATAPAPDVAASCTPRRCCGCGGLVYLPCQLCRVRTIKTQAQAAGFAMALADEKWDERDEAAERSTDEPPAAGD